LLFFAGKRGEMKKYLLLIEDEKGLLSLEKRVSLEIRETSLGRKGQR
jgi:hypothetical protein